MDAIVAMNPCVDAETQVDKDVTWAEFTDYSQFVNKYRITNFVFLGGIVWTIGHTIWLMHIEFKVFKDCCSCCRKKEK